MTNTGLLEEKIRIAGIKKNYIAKSLGITPYGLTLKMRNVNEFKVSEVEAICKMLGVKSLKEQHAIFFAKEVD